MGDLAKARDLAGLRRSIPGRLAENLFDDMSTPIGDLAGGARLEGLLDQLRLDRRGHLHRTVTEAAAIHETSFFRDVKVYESLASEVLPRLAAARERERRLRVWCAGCSTGQEAYSVAMLLCEDALPADWDLSVLGTDDVPEVVDYARQGSYRSVEVNAGLGAERLTRYFEPHAGRWHVMRRLRGICSFSCWSVCDPFPRLPVFDLVLMRNVLTYMDEKCRKHVFHDVRKHIAQDGYLVLGDLEGAEEVTEAFHEELSGECSVYRPTASS